MDITNAAEWQSLSDWIAAEFGRWDILVNAAGIARFDRVDGEMFENYRDVFAVNVEGSLLGMTAALEFMRKAGKGAIVNVSSCASLKGNPAMANYGASKAAISHFTRSAALEVTRAGHDIRINALLPGFIDTAMGDSIHDQFDDKLGGREGTLAVFSSGRAGTPEEMANVILFLVSDRASFVSGSTWVADRAQSA
jgi:3(or 17)beta-hydroxysteroid dehydrogenase